VWKALDAHVDRDYPHASGGSCSIEAISIDSSDGQTSDAVYGWVRKRKRSGVEAMAVKGRSTPNAEIFSVPSSKSIDPGYRTTKAARHGIVVFGVGTDRAKDLLLGFTADGGRIKRCDRAADGTVTTGRGPGRMHWYRSVRADFFEQLADSEVKIPSSRAGGKLVWTLKAGKRNEALDCTVYAEHAMRALRLNLSTESAWEHRRAAILRKADKSDAKGASGVTGRLGRDPILTRTGWMPTAAVIEE
jgi:phage terminase large subunit GpA-like protein